MKKEEGDGEEEKLTVAGQSCQTDARIITYYQSHWGSVQG